MASQNENRHEEEEEEEEAVPPARNVAEDWNETSNLIVAAFYLGKRGIVPRVVLFVFVNTGLTCIALD